MAERCASPYAELQGLLKDLTGSHSNDQLSVLADRALQLLPGLPSLDRASRDQRSLAHQLHSAAIALWNRTVALKSTGALSLSLNAQMRHIACSLVLLCNALELSESVFIKQITMAAKTGRAWLDSDNPTMAETSLLLASECWEKMNSQFSAAAQQEPVKKTLFKVLCFRIEAAVGLEQHEMAEQLLQQTREMLHTLQSEAGYLSMLCYNLGLDTFQKDQYRQSVTWLKESYEIGRGCSAVGAIKQARTLRLLANAYLEWDGDTYWQKALNAVGLANSEQSHPAGHLLKTNILLRHDRDSERLRGCLLETLRHSELTVELALAAVRRAAQHGRSDLAFAGVQELSTRYHGTPHLAQVRLLHLELLLGNKQTTRAKEVVEDVITADNTGEPLDVKNRKQFHLLFWEQAAAAYEATNYKEALQWYNYSLSIFPPSSSTDRNMAKLQRNRASCLMLLDELDKALEAVELAKQCDPDSPYGHFLHFKLAVLQGDEDGALNSLKAMASTSEESEDVSGLVCLAAQMTFEKSHRRLATAALEQVVQLSSSPRQTFTSLRCLIRLKLTFLNETTNKLSTLHSLLSYIQSAESHLTSGEGVRGEVEREEEAGWFMKVAWNLALQCDDNYSEMAQLFTACFKLSQHLVTDQAVLMRRKTCQLMSAAARLQEARATTHHHDKVQILEQVLSHVSECHSICQQIGIRTNDPSDPTHSILSLYEFEAKHHLSHPDTAAVLDRLSSQPSPEPKTFETIAALAMQGPQKGRSLAVKALKWSIHYHLQTPDPDWQRLSKCYHSHVQLVMEGERGGDRAAMEEGWTTLEEILDVLENKAQGKFPEMEILWLLTKAWNCGIHLYSTQRYKEAEQWCSLGMRFLKHLSQLRPSYEEQMAAVYSEVLTKLQSPHIAS